MVPADSVFNLIELLIEANTATNESIVIGLEIVSKKVEMKDLRRFLVDESFTALCFFCGSKKRIPIQLRNTTPNRVIGFDAAVSAWVKAVNPNAPIAP